MWEWLVPLLIGAGQGVTETALGGNQQQPAINYGSFEGLGALDPRSMVGAGAGATVNLGNALARLMSQDISLPAAFAQQPGGFSGGGLPMSIGLSGSDPALSDRSLLTRPGLDLGEGLFTPEYTESLRGTPQSRAVGRRAFQDQATGFRNRNNLWFSDQKDDADDALSALRMAAGQTSLDDPRRRMRG